MGHLKQRIRSLLLAADPIGIYFMDVDNQDEYDDIIDKIIPRLSRCRIERAAREAVWSAFVEAFGPQIAGDPDKHTEVALRSGTRTRSRRVGEERQPA
jgi:hypothetical protein